MNASLIEQLDNPKIRLNQFKLEYTKSNINSIKYIYIRASSNWAWSSWVKFWHWLKLICACFVCTSLIHLAFNEAWFKHFSSQAWVEVKLLNLFDSPNSRLALWFCGFLLINYPYKGYLLCYCKLLKSFLRKPTMLTLVLPSHSRSSKYIFKHLLILKPCRILVAYDHVMLFSFLSLCPQSVQFSYP